MPEEKGTEKVTEEQVTDALHQLAFPEGNETGIPKPETPEPEPSTEEAATPEAEPVAEDTKPESAAEEVEEPTQEDDLESLKTRIEETDKRHKEQFLAHQQRTVQNERILRDRYLRKSNATASALKILKAARSDDGVSQEEADRVIREMEGTMHPSSASYVAPEPTAAAATEDQALVLNNFLNEQGMTTGESEEFGKWIRSEATTVMSPTEQAVAGESLDGFLRLAHGRWQEGMREKEKETKRNDAVGAVKSVKRTQRAAAKAASGSPTAPRKQPAGPKKDTVDYEALKPDDISALLRQTVTQNN